MRSVSAVPGRPGRYGPLSARYANPCRLLPQPLAEQYVAALLERAYGGTYPVTGGLLEVRPTLNFLTCPDGTADITLRFAYRRTPEEGAAHGDALVVARASVAPPGRRWPPGLRRLCFRNVAVHVIGIGEPSPYPTKEVFAAIRGWLPRLSCLLPL